MTRIRKPRPRPILRAAAYVPVEGPRPNASQLAAAKHRAQPGRPTHDTEPIAPLKRAASIPPRQWLPLAGAGVLIILAMIALATYGTPQQPTALAITSQPTAAPTALPAVPTPTPEPPRTISAYAAPDGAVLGPIELDRMMTPKAHYGSAWIQADVEGSGLVWVRAADVPDLALVGPDLTVADAPPQSGQGLTLYQPPVVPFEPAPLIVPTDAPTDAPTAAPVPTDAPIVEIGPDTPPAGEFGGPGSSSGGDW